MAPIISRQHLPTFPDIFDSILLIRRRRVEGDDIGDQITLRRLHSNVSPSPEYDSDPALPAPPQLTQPPRPTRYTMHFSTRRKALHRAGPGHCIIKYIELAPCRHPPRDQG